VLHQVSRYTFLTWNAWRIWAGLPSRRSRVQIPAAASIKYRFNFYM